MKNGKKRRRRYYIVSVIFTLLVLATLFLLFEEEFVLHEINEALFVVLILLLFAVGSVWVIFHNKFKYDNNLKNQQQKSK